MPNWCENTVTIAGDKDKVKILWDAINAGAGFLATLRPEPDYDAVKVEPAFPSKDGTPDPMPAWWNWRVNHWGTKWDVDNDTDQFTFEIDNANEDATLTGNFESAWSPPIEALQYYADQNPDVFVEIKYYEPLMCFIGKWDSDGAEEHYNDVTEYLKIKPEDNPSLYELMDEFNVWANYDEENEDE